MLKRRASLLHFLHILEACWQVGVLEELLTDQSDPHKVINGTPGCYFYISLSTLPTTEVACHLAASGGSIRP